MKLRRPSQGEHQEPWHVFRLCTCSVTRLASFDVVCCTPRSGDLFEGIALSGRRQAEDDYSVPRGIMAMAKVVLTSVLCCIK